MPSSFSTALSGLTAHSTAIDVTGNNLANLNTTGFKASVVSFHDLVSRDIGATGDLGQVGLGVGRTSALRQFTQGNIQSGGGPLDAAIEGDGFFVLRDHQGQLLLSRAGNFRVDREGNLLSNTGERVQGWTQANGVLDTSGAAGSIVLPFGAVRRPQATTTLSADLNLNAGAADDDTFSTPLEIVDSLGATHVLTFTFTKTSANNWDYAVTIPGEELSGGTAGTPSDVATGSLTFDDEGNLTAPAPPPPATNGVVNLAVAGLANGAADLDIDWNFYNPDLTAKITQFAEKSAVAKVDRDGILAGQLVGVAIADGGQVIARYSTGERSVIAQLAMASVVNPDSLVAVGNNNFHVGPNTATPAIGLPESGGRGKILGETLEASTVDIAKEFTNLIVYQRGYQANSRVITTLDEVTQETLSIKR